MKTHLFNPFVKIAGFKALIFGLLFFAISLISSFYFHGIFDGVIDFHLVDEISFYDAFFCLLIDLLTLVAIFYPLGLILNRGKVRFIDIAGTFAFARFPLLILPLTNLGNYQSNIVQKIINSLDKNIQIVISTSEIIFLIFTSLVLLSVLIWYISLLYKAYTISANLKGAKAIISFIVGLILAEILSKIVIVTFIN